MSKNVKTVKVYQADWLKLSLIKIDSGAKNIADVIHDLVKDKKPRGG